MYLQCTPRQSRSTYEKVTTSPQKLCDQLPYYCCDVVTTYVGGLTEVKQPVARTLTVHLSQDSRCVPQHLASMPLKK